MTDWLSDLGDDDRRAWDEFVERFRRDALGKIVSAGSVFSILPSPGDYDVKYAAELGTALLLDKPLIVLVLPGTPVPERLRRAADEIVIADIDTEEGRRAVTAALKRMKIPERS